MEKVKSSRLILTTFYTSFYIGTQIEIAKSFTGYPKTEPRSLPVAHGVPPYLAGWHYEHWWRFNPPPADPAVERRTPGRAEAINLTGLSICVPQATVPLGMKI